MTYKEAGEPGYFLALISPKTEFQQEEILGKRITFVIDNSGSMAGERMKVAKDALKYCVQRLNPQDRFNVIRFATDVEALFPAPAEARGEAIQKAVSFVDAMEALGGTAIDDAMRLALKDGEKAGGSNGPHLVMFITDGQPTIGETSEEAIARNATAGNKAKSRVFTFGVGEDLNARLLDKLAADGHGASDYVKGGEDFEAKLSGFYDKVSYPVLADVALDLSGMSAYDVYPRKLPDLFKGSQLVVLGRYRTAGDLKVTLTGMVNGSPKKFEYGTTTFAKAHKSEDFIPRLWAIRKVGYLLEEIRLRGEKPELRRGGPARQEVRHRDPLHQLPGRRGHARRPDPAQPAASSPAAALPPELGAPEEERLGAGGGFGPVARKSMASPGGLAAGEKAPAPAMAAPAAEAFSRADGAGAIAIARENKKMKEEVRSGDASEPVRTAGGRTYLWRDGGWIDSEAIDGGARQRLKSSTSPPPLRPAQGPPGPQGRPGAGQPRGPHRGQGQGRGRHADRGGGVRRQGGRLPEVAALGQRACRPFGPPGCRSGRPAASRAARGGWFQNPQRCATVALFSWRGEDECLLNNLRTRRWPPRSERFS
jgi:Ca-activated chloride channel family protein